MNREKRVGRRSEDFTRRHARLLTGIATIAAIASLISATGCKQGVKAVVDVASFIPPERLTGSYTVPAGSSAIDLQVQPVALDLAPAVQGLANAETMTLDVSTRFNTTGGRGSGSATVFFGATAENVYSTPPVATLEATLAAGQSTKSSVQIPIDSRVLALFQSGKLWMGMRLHWAPTGPEALAGQYTITKIQAQVVSRRGIV